MYLLFVDEADQSGEKPFFCMAGVAIPVSAIPSLSNLINIARDEVGMLPTDLLKFSPRDRPDSLTPQKHIKVKSDIIDILETESCTAFCYAVPRGIANGIELPDRLKYGLNTLLMRFDEFLLEQNSHGIAFADRTTDYKQSEYFKQLFQVGSDKNGRLEKYQRIHGFFPSTSGHSHLATLSDLITGAIRIVINEPHMEDVGRVLLNKIVRIMWNKEIDGVKTMRDRGLTIFPKNIKATSYKADIEELTSRLNGFLKDAP